MPSPSSSNALTLGRPVIDLASIETIDDLRVAVGHLLRKEVGAGYPAPARDGDTQYQAVYARYTGGTWFLYGGKPSDPENPDAITSPFSGSTSISVTDEGGASLGAFSTLDFIGAGVTATDAGGGVAAITIPGGGGGAGTEVEIWGIDPAGGHTLTTSGTSLTLNLKIIKHTVYVTSVTSQIADDVDIIYNTGTEC
jgi:hypothetical protein